MYVITKNVNGIRHYLKDTHSNSIEYTPDIAEALKVYTLKVAEMIKYPFEDIIKF